MSIKLPEKISKVFEQLGNKLKSLDEKNLYLVFGCALIFIFVLDFLVLMQPQLNSLYKLRPNIKTLSEDIANTKINIGKIGDYKKQIDDLSKVVDQARYQVKSKEEVSIILEQISLIADRNKVRIDQIAPVFPDQKKVLETKDIIYFTLPIDIDAKATYHDLGRFLNQLENADIYLKISGFSIAYVETLRENMVKMTVEAIIYEKVKNKK